MIPETFFLFLKNYYNFLLDKHILKVYYLTMININFKSGVTMEKQARILIGKNVNGSYKKLCEGSLYSIGATFPKVEGMTDIDHENISRAARFLHEEKAANYADVVNGYRVSLF